MHNLALARLRVEFHSDGAECRQPRDYCKLALLPDYQCHDLTNRINKKCIKNVHFIVTNMPFIRWPGSVRQYIGSASRVSISRKNYAYYLV